MRRLKKPILQNKMKFPKVDHENAVIYFITFFIGMSISMMAPAVPEMRDYFHLTYASSGLILSTFGIARLILAIPSGYMYNHMKRKTLLFLGVFFLTVGSFIAGFSETFTMFIVSQVVMGIGFSICLTTIIIYLSIKATSKDRGSIMGMNSFARSAAGVIAPGIAGYICLAFTWRGIFWVYAGFSIINFIIIAIYIKDEEAGIPENDKEEKRVRSKHHRLIIATVFAVIFFALFVMSGFRNSTIPMYSTDVLNIDSGTIGVLLSIGAAVFLLTGPLAAYLSDRYGRKIFITTGILATAVAAFIFVFASSISHIVIVLIFLGYGMMVNVVATALLGDITPNRKAGRNYGLMRFVGDLGIVLGPISAGLMIDWFGFKASAAVICIGSIIAYIAVAIIVEDEKFKMDWKKMFFDS
jgi:MFS transporter, DHA1 family, multidrug resistance protein